MRKEIGICSLCLLLFWSCTEKKKESTSTLSITVLNAEGQKLYIEKPDLATGQDIELDSFAIQERVSHIDYTLSDTTEELYVLKTKDRRISVRFVNDAEKIAIECNFYEPDSFSVKGSPGSTEFYDFKNEATNQSKQLYAGLETTSRNDPRLLEAQKEFDVWSRNRIALLKDPIVTAYYFSYIDFGRDIDAYESYFNTIYRKFAEVPRWRILNEKAQQFIRSFREEVEVGEIFENCQLVSREGLLQPLLENSAGLTFIDFWASWYSPSVEEIPFKQEVYKKYGARGLKMISVALEPDIQPWKDFLKTGSQPWKQYIDPEVWSGTIANTYHLDSIPYNFVLDSNHKVIAKNLYKSQLIKWMDSVFKK